VPNLFVILLSYQSVISHTTTFGASPFWDEYCTVRFDEMGFGIYESDGGNSKIRGPVASSGAEGKKMNKEHIFIQSIKNRHFFDLRGEKQIAYHMNDHNLSNV
jgi:hypothetical protein